MDVVDVDLSALIDALRRRGGDSAAVEVKSARNGVPALGKTLSAFGNMPNGGLILLGLDERRGFEPVGLTEIAALEQGVAAQAREAVTPPVTCRFQTVTVDGADVLAVEVDSVPVHQRPVVYRGGAYLRQADGDYRMSAQELAQFELLKTQQIRPTRPDRRPVPGTDASDLDQSLLDAFETSVRRTSRRLAEAERAEVLRWMGVLTKSGEATLAGMYAMGRFPQGWRPSLGSTAAVRLPAGGERRTHDLVHLTGPLPELLEQATAWAARNIPTDMGYDAAGNGIDLPALPPRAIREVIANALVHRNLDAVTESKRVEIRIVRNRFIVTSPGGLVGVSLRQLGDPDGKSAVNATLYEICRHLRTEDGQRVIEGEGGGIREAQHAMAAAGLPAPVFRDVGLRFTAILQWGREPAEGLERGRVEALGRRTTAAGSADPARPAVAGAEGRTTAQPRAAGVSRNAGAVWEALTTAMSRPELAERTGLTSRQVAWALSRLAGEGLVEMVGGRGQRGTTYRRRSDAQPAR